MTNHETNVDELRDRVSGAAYQVDPVAVADAIVRRRWSVAFGSQPGSSRSMAQRTSMRARVSCIARHGSPPQPLAA